MIAEHRRVEAASQLAQLVERERELVAGAGEEVTSGRGVAVELAQCDAKGQCQRDDPLLRAVVEVALEPPPLDVARADDARA